MRKQLMRIISHVFLLIYLCFFYATSVNAEELKKTEKNAIYLTAEDRSWMVDFIEKFFLTDTMVYALFGSKPMAGGMICVASKEECIKSWESQLKTFSDKEKVEFLEALNEQTKKDIKLNENFQKWLQWKKNYPNPPFIFRTSLSEDKHYLLIDMINIREILWTLEKNHTVFSRETGMNFNPLEVTLDFGNQDSVFWKKVMNNQYLLGILYGFGERNSYFFSLYVKMGGKDHVADDYPLFKSYFHEKIPKKEDEKLSIENLDIPSFGSFCAPLMEDPVITHYKKERELIQKELKGKDFATEVLKKLLGKEVAFAPS